MYFHILVRVIFYFYTEFEHLPKFKTSNQSYSSFFMTHQEASRSIFKEIQAISKDYKASHPILQHQDAIGLGILLTSSAMIVLAMFAYLNGYVNMWITMLWIAFWTSFLHELEHDLIHYLYFKKNPFWHNFMMLGVWIFRPMTVSPWYRRYLHLHHHKNSGFDSDIEERGVTNGEKWGLFRAFIMPDQILSFVMRAHRLYPEIRKMEKEGKFTKEEVKNLWRIVFTGFLPVGIPLHLMWYAFVLCYAALGIDSLLGLNMVFPAEMFGFLAFSKPFIVLLVAPNLFRHFCLHFITSNLHYYGDLEKGNILQQTQIFNPWWTFPFQLFCFNFGTTHAIHHFFVQETFYVRQLTAKKAVAVLKEYGVRVNDIGTFKRANRYNISA